MNDHATVAADLLTQLREHLPQALKELEAERDRINGQIRNLHRIAKDLDPDAPPAQSSAKPTKPTKPGKKISTTTLLKVAEVCAAQRKPFTAHDIIAQSGINEPGVYVAIKELRAREFLAKAGTIPGTGVTPRALYVLDQVDVLDQIRGTNVT